MSGDRAMEGNSISSQKKTRIIWIDIMRGLLMFWVIFGHITEDKAQIVYIYSFHMPFFFLVSGMLHKNRDGISWKKYWKTLIVPFLFFNLVFNT